MKNERYSERMGEVMRACLQFAFQNKRGFVGSEHLLWALARDKGRAGDALRRNGVTDTLIGEYLQDCGEEPREDAQVLEVSDEVRQLFSMAREAARQNRHERMEPEDMLEAILDARESAAVQLLAALALPAQSVREALEEREKEEPRVIHLSDGQPLGRGRRQEQREEDEEEGQEETEEGQEEPQETAGSFLERFGEDLTQEAAGGRFDPMIGREDVTERLIQVLSRRTKNNPVLIGDPGVGKTAVVEGLAQRIVQGRVPRDLKGKRIISLDLTGMLAGARFRGDFEERLKGVLEEAQEEQDVILFLDELHTLIGAGAGPGDAMDAANMLKPVLARGKLRMIGATTVQEYRQHIEKDAALERRFQPVLVAEPSAEDTVKILRGLKERYEEFHGLTITDEAIRASVELSVRYLPDRFLPDKAIDLMDEAASRVKTRATTAPQKQRELEAEISGLRSEKEQAALAQEYERAAVLRDRQLELEKKLARQQAAWRAKMGTQVEAEDIAGVVSLWSGVPVTALSSDEKERLRNLRETLQKRVIGQDEAVRAVARAILRSRTGVAEPDRPAGSFLFLGPTGVGKTELCRALAEAVFGDEQAMIRLDMSEYREPHTVAKLIGSPPGYVGHEEGGFLTEQVRRRPYSLLLFDEIEKAHPDVWNTLLQILDDGRLTDSQGRTVNFKNTVIVLTSNVGARQLQSKKGTLGFAGMETGKKENGQQERRQRVLENVREVFPPEFINRLDEVLVFRSLEKEDIRRIARSMVERMEKRLAKQGVRLRVEESAVELLAKQGYDPVYGARPLRRSIQSGLQNRLADVLLREDYTPGDTVVATAKAGEISLSLRKKRRPAVVTA
ncbi:MAG: ATP-dependent Clp protease ATP-binding subunit [Eubacteriales bacterium]|nr:ATP-dependent Clp protease ATP-binding subunit [Eubacteriales bacterium]